MSDRVTVGSRVTVDGVLDGYGPWQVVSVADEWVNIRRMTDASRVKRERVSLLLQKSNIGHPGGASVAHQIPRGAERSQQIATDPDRSQLDGPSETRSD